MSAAPISLSAHSLIVSADILIVMTPKPLQLLSISCDFPNLRPSPTRKSKNILDKIYLLIKNSHPPLLYIIGDINLYKKESQSLRFALWSFCIRLLPPLLRPISPTTSFRPFLNNSLFFFRDSHRFLPKNPRFKTFFKKSSV